MTVQPKRNEQNNQSVTLRGKGNVKLTHNEQVDKLVDDSMRIMRMRSDFHSNQDGTKQPKSNESDLINRLAIQEHEEREKNRYHNKKPKKTKRKVLKVYGDSVLK